MRAPHYIEQRAVHEASHATCAALLGVEVIEARMDSVAGAANVVTHKKAGSMNSLRICLAGGVGEGLAFGVVDTLGIRRDMEQADHHAAVVTRDPDAADQLVSDTWSAVRTLLSDHWFAVEAVALALLECRGANGVGRLSGAEVADLVAGETSGSFSPFGPRGSRPAVVELV
jgi:hypothetical protein